MPQVRRKGDMGERSRSIAAGKLSESTLRNVNVINGLESKLATVRQHVLERNAIYSLQKMKNYETNIQDLRQKTIAYQRVVANHCIASAPDYQKALDEKYTLFSFRHEIKDMLFALHPDTIRKKRSQALIEASRERYQTAINSSQKYFNSLLPLKPKSSFKRKHHFKPSWHQEPVFAPPLPKVLEPKQSKKNDTKLKDTNIRDANLKNAYLKDVNKTPRTLHVKGLQATRKDKKNAYDKLPQLDSNFGRVREEMETNDNIEDWANQIPKELETADGRTKILDNSTSKTQYTVNDGERYKSKNRANRKKNSKTPSFVSAYQTSYDRTTKKQHGTHLQRNRDTKLKQTKHVSDLPTKTSEKKRHEIRNDSGYGSAESDFEITPRLRDGKEWKIMSQFKQKQ